MLWVSRQASSVAPTASVETTVLPQGLGDLAVNWLVLSPEFASDQTVLAATSDGIYRSTDRGDRWERVVDLRVEDHPEPLVELRRLVVLHGAYVLAGEEAGSKLEKANQFGVKVVGEKEFRRMIEK